MLHQPTAGGAARVQPGGIELMEALNGLGEMPQDGLRERRRALAGLCMPRKPGVMECGVHREVVSKVQDMKRLTRAIHPGRQLRIHLHIVCNCLQRAQRFTTQKSSVRRCTHPAYPWVLPSLVR
ncbi:hypothetical protein CALVIDRAFT_540423 [Calocera viscosa TUFC12733]|uniref:Uncharacterized protein n=1 Tax=Calocera viscosa (strain TUFC12733) TaxID=1330018 RepID=A0A167ITV9_CALVF|nr:hypothetical protein CALVIDRAFT_540423 [Calocera viscosa TUFC12733]